jgi:hypothetical protein
MAGYFDKPHHWRMRADMTRTIAAGMDDAEASKILLAVAADYDRMAQRLEAEVGAARGRRADAAVPTTDAANIQDRLVQLKRKWQG